ncbi:hypothetical protein DPMN_178376 [Dreissena polymorpha]|uniref:Uncharacterized protein n=1 Tax=Dreissena polymorpha TaxID=45954 RepID=A0A9D4EF34_DREPO|nr:hypothetical protein DPMN_178376 [Dreissena polymorpha]
MANVKVFGRTDGRMDRQFKMLYATLPGHTNLQIRIDMQLLKSPARKINILTKFHKDWMKTATSIVYTSDLMNILTKFHKDWMKTVTSTVYTNKLLTDGRTHTHTDAGHHTVT